MAEHRASVLSSSRGGFRRYEDPARSRDPRIRRLVAELAVLEPGPAPHAHFRAELRAQLVAVAPRLVTEGVASERPVAAESGMRRAAAPARNRRAALLNRGTAAIDRLTSVNIAKPVALITAVVAVFAMLLGGSVWMSKKSLPGDPLYALKRANEDVQLSLTTSDQARGAKYLDFASNRVDEVSALLKRADAIAAAPGPSAAAGISAHTAKLVTDTLDDADHDVRSAAQVLGGEAVDQKSGDPLQTMTNWAPGQIVQMQTIASRIPAGPLHDRADQSAQLLMDAMGRAAILEGLAGCSCLGASGTDDLGPIPCTVCVSPPAVVPPLQTPTTSVGSSGATKPGSSGSNTGGSTTAGGTESGATDGSVIPGVSTDGGSGSSSPGGVQLPTVLPTITVPNLPLPTPTHSATCVINLLGICVKI